MLGSGINLLVSIILFCLGGNIYKGNLSLVHKYHQEKVKDIKGYSKSLGLLIIIYGLGTLISFFVGLLVSSDSYIPDIIFIISSLIFVIKFIIIQRKYNGKVFG